MDLLRSAEAPAEVLTAPGARLRWTSPPALALVLARWITREGRVQSLWVDAPSEAEARTLAQDLQALLPGAGVAHFPGFAPYAGGESSPPGMVLRDRLVDPGGPAGAPRAGAGDGAPGRLREAAPSHLVPETETRLAPGRRGAPGAAAGDPGGPGLPPHGDGRGPGRIQLPRHGGGPLARPPGPAPAPGDLRRRAGAPVALRSGHPAPHGRGPGIAHALSPLRGGSRRWPGPAGGRGLPGGSHLRTRGRPGLPPGAAGHPRPLSRRGAVPSRCWPSPRASWSTGCRPACACAWRAPGRRPCGKPSGPASRRAWRPSAGAAWCVRISRTVSWPRIPAGPPST